LRAAEDQHFGPTVGSLPLLQFKTDHNSNDAKLKLENEFFWKMKVLNYSYWFKTERIAFSKTQLTEMNR